MTLSRSVLSSSTDRQNIVVLVLIRELAMMMIREAW